MFPTRDEILQALDDPNPNPLAEAVAAAISRYSDEFERLLIFSFNN